MAGHGCCRRSRRPRWLCLVSAGIKDVVIDRGHPAHARNITIVRGKERGEHYLRITDDGDGIPRDKQGIPNFKYVATHICDSIKRQLKAEGAEGAEGIQGEFGIGLLSFWTVGEEITLTCSGADGKTYQMLMKKGSPNYTVTQKRTLFPDRGTELTIKPLLTGIRQFSGEKIQWYLASELRDRIRRSGAQIRLIDRQARKEFKVEPRQFTGRLLHQIPVPNTPHGEVYLELYLAAPDAANRVGLYRLGTRVLEDITRLDLFQHAPWTSGYLQGIVEAPFLNLTPGTRTGVIQDAVYAAFCTGMEPAEAAINAFIDEQKRAEEEHANRQTLRTIQKAFKEALLALPAEEYDWFDVHQKGAGPADADRNPPGRCAADGGGGNRKQGRRILR